MEAPKNITCIKLNILEKVNDDMKEQSPFKNNTFDINDDDVVWQQMPLNHFNTFLNKQALAFRQLSTYSSKDERKVCFYKQTYLNSVYNDGKKMILHNLYNDFEKIAYISCWYHAESLSKLVFKEYADNLGIAIGTTIKQLTDAIHNNNKADSVFPEELYYGKTAYINDGYKAVVAKEESVAPLFLKNTSTQTDNELRLVYLKDSLWKSRTTGLELPNVIDTIDYIKIGEISQFINYIAINQDSTLLKTILKEYKLKAIKAPENEQIDGFDVYKIERM